MSSPVLIMQGFYPNVRQQRAAGFAMIELAQAVRKLVSVVALNIAGRARL